MRQIVTKNWKRISKAKAKKMFMMGDGQLLILPCKIDPENNWGIGHYPPQDRFQRTEEDWEKYMNEYYWYNFQYNEWGKYPAFYERRQG